MDALISADDCPGQISHYGTHQISNVLQISQNFPISHNQRHQISKVYQLLQKEPNIEVTNQRISNWNWRSCLCHVMFISSLTIHLFITVSLHVVKYEELRRYYVGKIYLDDKSEVYTEWFLRWGKTSNFRRSMVDQYWEQLLEGRGRWKRYSSNYLFHLYDPRNMKWGEWEKGFSIFSLFSE